MNSPCPNAAKARVISAPHIGARQLLWKSPEHDDQVIHKAVGNLPHSNEDSHG